MCCGVDYVFGVRDVAELSNIPHTKHIVYAAACRTSNLLQLYDNTPLCCKQQSYAPEDGQKIARNMLSCFKDQ